MLQFLLVYNFIIKKLFLREFCYVIPGKVSLKPLLELTPRLSISSCDERI